MKIIDKYVVSETEPTSTAVAWFRPSTKMLSFYVNNGWEAVASPIPAATADTLGGVKVGDGLSVTEDGTLSASGPLIIEGVYDTDMEAFIPKQGQPGFAEAVAAINSGRQVFLRFNWDVSKPEAIADFLVTFMSDNSALGAYDLINARAVTMYNE